MTLQILSISVKSCVQSEGSAKRSKWQVLIASINTGKKTIEFSNPNIILSTQVLRVLSPLRGAVILSLIGKCGSGKEFRTSLNWYPKAQELLLSKFFIIFCSYQESFTLFRSDLRHFNTSWHKLCILIFLEIYLVSIKPETQTRQLVGKMVNKWNFVLWSVVEGHKVVLNIYWLEVTLEYLCNTNRKCIEEPDPTFSFF